MSQMENQFPWRSKLYETTANRKTQNKSELCLRFQRGNCEYGDRCYFSHGNGDLRGVNKRQEVVLDNDGSRVKNWDDNQNPRCIDKSKLCWRFMNGEKCLYGDRCHFYHGKPERKSVAISILNGAENDQMQHQKQTPWKTKLCSKWMSTGSCGFGLNCSFAHGESELREQGSKNAEAYAKDAPCEKIDTTHEKQVDRKCWEFKWKNIEKIARIYGDWIDDMPINHDETGDVAS